MDWAAERGFLQIVQFLHSHRRSEGCTVAAMDKAVRNGHLDVVEYLHTHCSEGCTVEAVLGAIQGHHFCILHFLREHYPHFFGPELLHGALLYGSFDLFLDLQANYPTEAEAVVGQVMFDAGEALKLPTKRRRILSLRAVQMLTANVEHGCQMHSPVESVRSLVSVCFEEGAREVLADFAHRTQSWGVLNAFTTTSASELRTLHPFLAGPRTPSWAVYGAFDCRPDGQDPYGRCRRPFTWAVRAAYAGDMTMLEITSDFSASAHLRQDCAAQNLDPAENDPQAIFQGARAAAIRKGNLSMLRWLLTEIDLPVEPSLLTEAVYYHKYGIALWLVGHCPETDWESMVYAPSVCSCGLDDGLLEWLASHPPVRAALEFGSIIDDAARMGDGESLRTLHTWYPQVLMDRPKLLELANKSTMPDPTADAVRVLRELGYRDHILVQ